MCIHKYRVWWPENGQTQGDAHIFEGFDHEGAAAEWANWYDDYSEDFLIVGGATPEVQVLREGETQPRTVLVMGETVRRYSGHLTQPTTETNA